jgi:hypothetical protein
MESVNAAPSAQAISQNADCVCLTPFGFGRCEKHPWVKSPLDEATPQTVDTGVIRQFATGATRDTANDKLDYEGFECPRVMRAYAEYMHENRKQSDGTMRDSDNWQKGIPLDAYMKSLFRHFMEVWEIHRGVREGDIVLALMAARFNVNGYAHEVLKTREGA